MNQYDVVVAGAGPVGLMLGCELALAGVRVVVLERLSAPDPTIKAGAITAPTAEAFDRRGMLPELQAAQERTLEQFRAFIRQRTGGAAPARPASGFAGHFAAIMLRRGDVDESDPLLTGHGPSASVSMVGQQELEAILAGRAGELGVEVRRGVELTGFTAYGDGVEVTAGDAAIRAGWLVGCDGGRSLVRRLAGFAFPGTDPEITGHQAIVELEGAERLGAGWNCTERGVYVHGPMPGRILTVEFDGAPEHRDRPVTAEELQASLRNVSGTEVRVTEVRSATRWTDNARQATTYRLGRVLLAGDAAHVHSPFGGQGLNLGIGDAFNLGWKLGAVVHGWAPDGLLDTYTAERHPVGEWVLDWTRAQVALMRPRPKERALRRVVADLAGTVAGTTQLVTRISGVSQRYDLGGGHPLVGASAPDLELADGSRLADHLHSGTGLLLDLADSAALRHCAEGYRDRVRVVRVARRHGGGLTGLLLRPDGVVAWAADGAARGGQLRAALARWFGEPSVAAV